MSEIKTTCPACGEVHPLATPIKPDEDGGPSDGDASICFSCGAISIFDRKVREHLRRPTIKEAKEIADDYEIQFALSAWHQIMKRSQ